MSISTSMNQIFTPTEQLPKHVLVRRNIVQRILEKNGSYSKCRQIDATCEAVFVRYCMVESADVLENAVYVVLEPPYNESTCLKLAEHKIAEWELAQL